MTAHARFAGRVACAIQLSKSDARFRQESPNPKKLRLEDGRSAASRPEEEEAVQLPWTFLPTIDIFLPPLAIFPVVFTRIVSFDPLHWEEPRPKKTGASYIHFNFSG